MTTWEAYEQILFFKMLDALAPERREALSPSRPLIRVLKTIKYYASYLKSYLSHLIRPQKPQAELEGKCWFFIGTKNQRDSLSPIKEQMAKAEFVSSGFQYPGDRIFTLDLSRRWLFAFRYLGILRQIWLNNSTDAFRYFDHLMYAMGLFECYVEELQRYKVRAVILGNDHNISKRCMLFAAKHLGIPTIYIQHASVSRFFPPLKFDLSLLEGQDSLDKYTSCGPVEGQVEFVGMPKFDGYEQKRNWAKCVKRVGICCSPLDDYAQVQAIIHRLIPAFPNLAFTFRKHPGDQRNFSFKLTSTSLKHSDPHKEAALDFLCKQDLIIAGNSAIHLEAVLLNVESLYYPIDGNPDLDDYYGFERNGLTNRMRDIEQIVEVLTEKQDKKENVYLNAKYYNHFVGTPEEGKGTERAISYIHLLLGN